MADLCTLVLTGAPLTTRAPDLAAALIAAGWDLQLVATLSAGPWLDEQALVDVVGHAPQMRYRAPGQPRRGGRPDAVVVAPATFNTVNKIAAGIADTYAHSVLCEALAVRVPMVIVPMVNDRLWGHPAWAGNLDVLRLAGVRFVDILSGNGVPSAVPSGTGDKVVAGLDPQWVVRHLSEVAQTRRP